MPARAMANKIYWVHTGPVGRILGGDVVDVVDDGGLIYLVFARLSRASRGGKPKSSHISQLDKVRLGKK